MFEQTFKNIDDVLWKEAGCTTELDYTEQTSWMLFLKYLDDLEQDRAMQAELKGKTYEFIIDAPHRWSSWAAPKDTAGNFDHNTAKTGDDLIDYVNRDLFPYLQGFKQRATGPDTIEYKIGEIFGEIKNRFTSGYSLRDALEYIDALRFQSQREKHELSHIYEAKIKNMGNAGRNGFWVIGVCGKCIAARRFTCVCIACIARKISKWILRPQRRCQGKAQ
jgi:type I restriction enzyme M protein